MASAPASPTKSKSRDTGFPDDFCGHGNTSLPHPDADLSGHACITSADVPLGRVHSRQRRQYQLHRHSHKHTISSGILAPSGMFSDRTPISESGSMASTTDVTKATNSRGRDSIGSGIGSGSDGSPPGQPQDRTKPTTRPYADNTLEDSAHQPQESKKRSFFGRLVHHN